MEGRSEEKRIPEVFSSLRAPFLSYYWRVSSAYLFIVALGRISKEGRIVHWVFSELVG
jgi:hypothetical protein